MKQGMQFQESGRCPEDRDAMMDEYLAGSMNDADMDRFERHYFQCDNCFEELQLRVDIARMIRSEGPDLFPEPAGADGGQEAAPEYARVASRVEAGQRPHFAPENIGRPWLYVLLAFLLALTLLFLYFILP